MLRHVAENKRGSNMGVQEQYSSMAKGLTSERVQSKNIMRRGNQAVVLPHQRGFASMTNWLSRTYRFTFDEALKRDYNTAKAMLNDAFIQGLLRNRILPTAKSQWKIKATGPGASEEIERFYESALKQIPLWHDFRRNLLQCVWHGRYGIQFATDSMSHDYRKFLYEGRPINTISHWLPHSGDKITFTWDGIPAIRINPMYVSDWKHKYGATVLQPNDSRLAQEAVNYRWTEEGPVMLLDNPEIRRKFAIPVFEVSDAPWDEPDMAGGVRGIGLRHYAFWTWDQRQEVVGWAMLHLEDFGAGGYTVIGYDGPEALKRNTAAFDNPETRVIHVPMIPGNEERITDQVTRLTPAGEGNDAIFQWAESYFNAHLTILFTGHPLNSQAAPTGMGSDMANKSTDILKSIQKSDAEVVDGTMTQEVLPVIQKANNHDETCQLEFVSEIREADKESGMKAAKQHFDMGGKVGKRYSHMLSDVPEVEDGEDFLQSPSFKQQEQQDALMAQGIMPAGQDGEEGGGQQQIPAQPPPNRGASKALKERGSQHGSKLAGTFPAGQRVTLEQARQNLAAQGVPDEEHLAALAWAVSTAAAIEHDEADGVQYTRGPGAWPADGVVSYSTEGVDPASKWEAIDAPIKGGTRWRNIETGTITYVQPGAGRNVQSLPGDKNKPGQQIDKAQGGTEDVALLPGKGIATSGVEEHVTMLAQGSSKIAGEAGVLDAVRHVDKRLLKKQTVALAGRLGLGVSSKTSKTEALAYIEDTLRARSNKPAGGTGAGESNSKAMTSQPGEGETKGSPPAVSNKLEYGDFEKKYTEAFKKMSKYKPGQIGSDEAAEEMSTLADENPGHLEKLEASSPPRGGEDTKPSKHHQMVDETLSKSKLNDETKKKYGDAAKSVHDKLPQNAKDRLEKNLNGFQFHESSESLKTWLTNRSPELKSKIGEGKVSGAFSKQSGKLHLDGEGSIDGSSKTHEEIYAHEYAHAIDGPGHDLSKHADWKTAWQAEAGEVSKYATKTPQEGFAEFGRIAYASGLDNEQLKQKFPKMAEYWEKNQLLQESAGSTGKLEEAGTPQLQDVFSEPFDTEEAIGDKPLGTDGDRSTAEATYNAGLSKSPIPTDDDEEEAQAVTPAGAAAVASYEGDAAARDHANRPREDGESLKGYLKRIGKAEHHEALSMYARGQHRQEKEIADYHNSAIKEAHEGLARAQGTKVFNMTQARKDGDYTKIPGFDTVKDSVASNHPGIFAGVDAGYGTSGEETGLAQSHGAKLWDMLKDGKKPYRTIREHEDKAIAEHHEAGWPSIKPEEPAETDPRLAGEAAEPENADTSFDFGGNEETQAAQEQPKEVGEPGTEHTLPALAGRSEIKAKFFESTKEGMVGVGYAGGDQAHTVMPKESAKHFVNDLSGKVDLPADSGHPVVDALARGEGEHLGKGQDGVAFKVGDKVAKMSTTVPFQPFNPGHRTPEEAKQHIKKAVDVNNKLHEKGIPGLLKNEYVEHGDKAFAIRDHLEMPDKLTPEQLRSVRHTVDRMHEEGYVVGDQIQVGLKDGKPYLFDLGNAQKARDEQDYEDDSGHFERFAKSMGGEALPLGRPAKARHESAVQAGKEHWTDRGKELPGYHARYTEEQRRGVEESELARQEATGGFMQQEKAGKWNEGHVAEMAGQSFTNDQGLTVDLRKEDDGTYSIGSQKGLTQAGAAKHLNSIGAEKAQSLFGDDVQAQGDIEKPKEKLQWQEPTKRKDGPELPGMRDAFAPGMFGAAANQAEEQPKEIHEQVAEHFGIPPEAAKDALSTSFSKLQERDKAAEAIPSNHDEAPYTDYEKHELGTMRAANWNSNPKEAYVDYLTEHNPAELVTSEPEDGIKKSETYGKYAEWAKAGHEPPPISTSKAAKEGSKVVSSNRRRLLAAQEAGVEKIKAWHSPENPHTGNPLKYGDIIEHAKSLGWEEPAAEQPGGAAPPRGGKERVKLDEGKKAQAGEAYVNAYKGAAGDEFDDHFEQAKDIKHMSAAELKEVAAKINYPIAGKTREAMANELLRVALEKRGVNQRASMVRSDAKASKKSRHSLDDYQDKPTGKAAEKAELLKKAEALDIFGMKNKSTAEIQAAIDAKSPPRGGADGQRLKRKADTLE